MGKQKKNLLEPRVNQPHSVELKENLANSYITFSNANLGLFAIKRISSCRGRGCHSKLEFTMPTMQKENLD
jgi:hypothetical protein